MGLVEEEAGGQGHAAADHGLADREAKLAFKDAVRAKTKRTTGRSLQYIVADVNHTLRGWFAYFQHSYRTTFPTMDGWIRGRLRSILRRRAGLRGRGRGADHQRWPNAFFAKQGLFSLVAAHELAVQSSQR